jgi:hypothetical protein
MSYETGTVTNASGSFSLAHQNLLELIKNKVTNSTFMGGAGNVWAVERYVTTGDHELILRGPGLSGTEEIYVGIKLYHDVNADYYNCKVAGFTGYVSGNTFETQPGASGMLGVPLHNLSITYWLVANGQRIVLAAKVGTPVYESFYIGKFLPYATPSQYPYPICAAGMLSSASATRFSETTHSIPYKGNRANMQVRFVDGLWKQPYCWPWNNLSLANTNAASNFQLRESPTDHYPLLPVILTDAGPSYWLNSPSNNTYGELDGIYHVSGFNNVVENTVTIGGTPHLIVQDVWRNSHIDYYALKLS